MKKIARVLLTLVIVVAGCVGGYELWDYYLFSPWTRDARVQADVVNIAPDVAGFVTDLRVKDNQFVHKGDVLLVIDRERYTRALAMAEATVAARKATMDNAQQTARQARQADHDRHLRRGARGRQTYRRLGCCQLSAGGR
jgi:multidrug resistance efflux pump